MATSRENMQNPLPHEQAEGLKPNNISTYIDTN